MEANLRLTPDRRGFFGYNDNFKAYVEVISFDRLPEMAHRRNHAFFDGPVSPAHTRSGVRPAQHGHLVPQREYLRVLGR